ncbi:hypothetical protein EYF80_026841 [Liparis tanakae]|uniref:Uncharacterized protein n=1 Tax=Liparis tanakae TaxID=230148 RepID=A0A4Z2HBF6_9TELE|nr:hypothetical protein EYF80_026841 [Liparis tanakae]
MKQLRMGRNYLDTMELWGLRHIAKDLHGGQQVASVEVPPLSEVQQVFGDLGHPIPSQHPLALCKCNGNEGDGGNTLER